VNEPLLQMAVGLYKFYISLLFLLALLTGYRFRQYDKATRMMGLLVFLSLATELTGRYITPKSNHLVYNVSCMVEWVLVCLYFNYAITAFEVKRLGWYFAIGGIFFGIYNFSYLQPIDRIGSIFLYMECLGISLMSFYAIYSFILIDDDNLKPQRKVHYWLPFILVFYQCGSLWSWMVHNYYVRLEKETAMHLLHVLLISISTITYGGLATVFYLYPKLRTTHV